MKILRRILRYRFEQGGQEEVREVDRLYYYPKEKRLVIWTVDGWKTEWYGVEKIVSPLGYEGAVFTLCDTEHVAIRASSEEGWFGVERIGNKVNIIRKEYM